MSFISRLIRIYSQKDLKTEFCNNNVENVRRILLTGEDVNRKLDVISLHLVIVFLVLSSFVLFQNDFSLLTIAAHSKSLPMVRMLLELGAEPNVVDKV